MGWLIQGDFNTVINQHFPKITLKHNKKYINVAKDGIFSGIDLYGHPSINLLQITFTGFSRVVPKPIDNFKHKSVHIGYDYTTGSIIFNINIRDKPLILSVINHIADFKDIPNNVICDMMKTLGVYDKNITLKQCQRLYDDGDLDELVEFAIEMESLAPGICFELANKYMYDNIDCAVVLFAAVPKSNPGLYERAQFEIASFKLSQGEVKEAYEYSCNAGESEHVKSFRKKVLEIISGGKGMKGTFSNDVKIDFPTIIYLATRVYNLQRNLKDSVTSDMSVQAESNIKKMGRRNTL